MRARAHAHANNLILWSELSKKVRNPFDNAISVKEEMDLTLHFVK